MTYNSILDTFFGSNWLRYGLIPVYLVIVFLLHKRIFGGKKRKLLFATLYYGVPIVWFFIVGMANPTWWGYGKPEMITALRVENGKLYAQDYVLTAGGKMSKGSPYGRVHVIDAKTGERLLRFSVGHGKENSIIGIRGDTLAYASDDRVTFYSITDGRELLVWSAETLPKLYPELASGLHNFSAYKTRVDLHVSSMDGSKWMLNIMDKSITKEGEAPAYPPRTDRLFVEGGAICRYRDVSYSEEVIGLESKDGEGAREVICGENDSVLNNELIFLEGNIVALSLKDSCFVVKHYETIAKTRAIFTCVSLDGKRKLWEVRQSVLLPDDDGEEEFSMFAAIDEANGLFIISIDDELITLSLKDGKVMWREIP
ncbi:MAG TPA: PQQ-binding-like beta-propeller repeat protein [Bacteroidia bacterium]|nr:PQQ-binding-like beta-propeller repeat protein [Bacteroidia bacterium]